MSMVQPFRKEITIAQSNYTAVSGVVFNKFMVQLEITL